MANRMYLKLTAGENLVDGDVVRITGVNTVSKVSSIQSTIVGVADETIANTVEGRICIWGRKTVACSGLVTAGDLVMGTTAGKVIKFTATTSITSEGHRHDLEGGTTEAASSNTDGATVGFVLSSGEFAAGHIIGKAFTGGTNTDIDILVKKMG